MTDQATTKAATLAAGEGAQGEFPVLKGTLGPDVIDIRKLYGQTGMFTYDPGFTSTASCSSKITFIDGDEGVLLHRGYTIEDLAKNSSFLEVAYLILNGELPKQTELDEFMNGVTYHTMLHEQIQFLFRGFRRDAHPMAVMIGVVGALSAFYYEDLKTDDEYHREIATYRMIAKIPTIAAMCHKYAIGQPFVYPRNDLSYAENFLHMMFAVPCEPYKVNPVLAQGAGPHLHPARRSRAERLDLDRAAGGLDRRHALCGDRGRHRRVVGTGARRRQRGRGQDAGRDRQHRRRPGVSREGEGQGQPLAADGLRAPGLQELRPARRRAQGERRRGARAARPEEQSRSSPSPRSSSGSRSSDDYFAKRKLFPNVDFYSGIILEAMGIPTTMFTAIFALARTVGLDGAVERDDRRSRAEDRPAAPALHRPSAAELHPDGAALSGAQR